MARIKKVYLEGKLLLLPHPFEDEVNHLLRTNHRLLSETITRIEQEEISALCENIEDPAELGGEIAYTQTTADELRRSANSLILVGLVTRFQHWVRLFVEELTNKNAANKALTKNLQTLTNYLGVSPESLSFFEGLEIVRDSIIHADSTAEWMRGNTLRSVPNQYRDASGEEVEVKETDLHEAIDKAIVQIKWYDNRLEAIENSQKG